MTTDTEPVVASDRGAEVAPGRHRSLRYVSVAAAAAPAILIVVLVVRYWTNVPFWDDWEFYSTISAYHHGTLSFATFYAQHNEHRILFPNLVMFVLAQASGWDVRWEMCFSLVVALVTFGLLALMLRRGLRSGWLLGVTVPLASLVLFSPVQYENWLWGWQIEWFMMVLGVVGALCALSISKSPRSWKPVVVAMAAATLATYSVGSGMLVWVACLPVLLVDRRLRRWTPVWVVLAAVEIGLYFTHYQKMSDQDSITTILGHPKAFGHYLSIYLARPLVSEFSPHKSALVTGWLLVVLAAAFGYLAVRRRADLVVALPWFCLAGYTVLAGTVTASSRLVFGLEQAAASRYTAISNLFVVSTIAVVCVVLEGTWRRRGARVEDAVRGRIAARSVPVLSAVVLVLIGALALVNYRPGLADMRHYAAARKQAQACALHATGPDDPCLTRLYPDKKAVWDRIQYLRSIHMGGV
jgi:hypothetical protein